MSRTRRWVESEVKDGVSRIALSSWKYFHDFVYQEMLDFRDYIWRGHRCDNWLLEPTLDRALKGVEQSMQTSIRRAHLRNFKMAVRGRRGPNPSHIGSEDEWWALGQHYGLYSPLLDWTNSPFVAAYFAFANQGTPQTRRRAVFAVDPKSLMSKDLDVIDSTPEDERPKVVYEVRPLSDDNPRLVNQGGLFLRAPDNTDLETWVRKKFVGVNEEITLMKITIPDSDREMALRSLNRMNINHLSLFPDLTGASQFCNTDLIIKNY
jgi:hypothetical protein